MYRKHTVKTVTFTPYPRTPDPQHYPKNPAFGYVYLAAYRILSYPLSDTVWEVATGERLKGVGEPINRHELKKRFRGNLGIFLSYIHICICMGSQKERQERLMLLAKMKKQHEEDEVSEVLSRHLLEDYMIQIWFLGYQTRMDYLNVLFRTQKR